MSKKNQNPSKTAPPPAEKADKVLSELIDKADDSLKAYNDRLTALHSLFKKEPQLINTELASALERVKIARGDIRPGFADKVYGKLRPIINFLTPWSRRRRRYEHAVAEYIISLHSSVREFNDYKAEFHTALLQYTQNVGPLVNDLHSKVAREVTVFPIERMDLVFTELLRQIEQLKSEVERLKTQINGKHE